MGVATRESTGLPAFAEVTGDLSGQIVCSAWQSLPFVAAYVGGPGVTSRDVETRVAGEFFFEKDASRSTVGGLDVGDEVEGVFAGLIEVAGGASGGESVDALEGSLNDDIGVLFGGYFVGAVLVHARDERICEEHFKARLEGVVFEGRNGDVANLAHGSGFDWANVVAGATAERECCEGRQRREEARGTHTLGAVSLSPWRHLERQGF